MNSLVSAMLGRPIVQEDDSVPVPVTKTRSARRSRENDRLVNRRTITAIMGMAEDQESIFPADAVQIDGVTGFAPGIKGGDKPVDRAPEEPEDPDYAQGEDLMSPTIALVAPDVTPQALQPLDPSQVPPDVKPSLPAQPATPNNGADALQVLLGKASPDEQSAAITTAESAQASVNASLGLNSNSGGLREGQPMPLPTAGKPEKIMEAFYKFVKI